MLNVENLSTLLSNKSDNLYVLCSVEVSESEGKLSVNAPIPTNTITKLCKVINNFDTDRLVIVCRSPLEQYTKPFPYPEALKKIKREIKKEGKGDSRRKTGVRKREEEREKEAN